MIPITTAAATRAAAGAARVVAIERIGLFPTLGTMPFQRRTIIAPLALTTDGVVRKVRTSCSPDVRRTTLGSTTRGLLTQLRISIRRTVAARSLVLTGTLDHRGS